MSCFISIHAPREGSDANQFWADIYIQNISIHAPREGSDRTLRGSTTSHKNFNPRSPRGERRFL